MPNAIEVTGVDPLLKVLQQFPPKLQKKALRPGLRDGSKITQQKAKEFVPVDADGHKHPGGKHLRDTIKVRANPGRKRGVIEFRVMTGTREELGIPANDPTYYPNALEFGDLDHQPIKFMGPAYEHTQEAVIETVRAKVMRELARIGVAGD